MQDCGISDFLLRNVKVLHISIPTLIVLFVYLFLINVSKLLTWRGNNSEVTKPKPEVKDLTKSYQFIVRS
jgi:hypothetical protein